MFHSDFLVAGESKIDPRSYTDLQTQHGNPAQTEVKYRPHIVDTDAFASVCAASFPRPLNKVTHYKNSFAIISCQPAITVTEQILERQNCACASVSHGTKASITFA